LEPVAKRRLLLLRLLLSPLHLNLMLYLFLSFVLGLRLADLIFDLAKEALATGTSGSIGSGRGCVGLVFVKGMYP